MTVETKPVDVTTVMVPCKHIEWPKVKAESRTIKKDFVQQLAQSIRLDGLLNPVTVRPNRARPGHYIGVAGEHRYTAVARVLKYDLIECKVIEADDAQAAIKTAAENLFRNPLNKSQLAYNVKLWHDAHVEETVKFEEGRRAREEQKAAAKAARGEREAAAPGQVQNGPAAEPEAGPEPTPPPKNFAADVAAKTGKSETSVKRSLAIAKAFDAEQLEVLEQMGVSQTWTETISKLPEKSTRDKIVNLIASGKSPEESVSDVTGQAEIAMADGKVKSAPTGDEGLTDLEWVEHHCSGVLGILVHKEPFIADAILYRQTAGHRAHFKAKVKGMLEAAKKGGATAGLYGIVRRLGELSHPKHWVRCGACLGNGVVAGEAKRCNRCLGAGYQTTSEVIR